MNLNQGRVISRTAETEKKNTSYLCKYNLKRKATDLKSSSQSYIIFHIEQYFIPHYKFKGTTSTNSGSLCALNYKEEDNLSNKKKNHHWR